jgi:peptidylamidoglycolate lyase
MAGIAVAPDGRIWTFNRGPKPVQIIEADGSTAHVWEGKEGDNPVEFREPHQIRFDRGGNVWLVDSGLHVVREFTPEGKLLRSFGILGEAGEDAEHLDKPTDVAIASDGEIFIADGYGNNRIVHFDAQGNFVKSWGSLGSAPGEFSLPHSIAIDSKGRLYVADRNNARVQVFDRSGKFLDEWRNLLVPWHIAINEADEIYVCGSSPMRWPRPRLGSFRIPGLVMGIPPKDQLVMVFTPEGRVNRLWTFPMGKRAGEVDWVHGMDVDVAGNLYLGDILGRRAQRFVRIPADPAEENNRNLADQKPRRDAPVRRAGGEKQPE